VSLLAGGIAREVHDPTSFVLENLAAMREILRQLRGHERDLVGDPEELVAELDEMVRESILGLGRVRDIVARLRAFTKVDEERVEWVDPNELVESACMLAGNEIRAHAALVKRLEPLRRIPADPGKLAQVLVHVLVNAAQAVENAPPRRHEVTVTTESIDEHVVITVEDTGCGIAPDALQHVFDPFFSTKPRGIGLGLSLSHEIVRNHRGTIEIDSTVGEGTRVSLRIPFASGLRVTEPPEPVPVVREAEAALRVLVIDDEPLVLAAIGRTLAKGHEVVLAEGGKPGLDHLASGRAFDVVLCDLMMPDVDGADVYERGCILRPDLADRFVFLSGGAYVAKLRTFAERHRDDLVDKPVSPRDLRSRVRQAAERDGAPRR
jgi:CheY-like chemotaxis protein